MGATAAPAPVRGSWRRVAVGLGAFILAPLIPAMRILLPVEQTTLLVVAMVAVCAIVAWKNGGPLVLALIWAGIAAVLLASPLGPADGPYSWLARGWILVLGASFGLVSVVVPSDWFFPRALSSLAVAMALGFSLVLVSPGGPSRIAGAMLTEYNRRNTETLTKLRQAATEPGLKEIVNGSPPLQAMLDESETQLESIPKVSAVLVPAILALESLAALGLGWALFHLMSPVRIGPALGKLRDFRFNDQLVWGVAVGASIYLLPAFADGRNAGLNLLVFFGFLYLVRGMGVIAWMSRTRMMTYMIIALAVVVWPFVALFAIALGLGDTWLDWRSRTTPRPS
jgi:hypothetical protein